MYIWHRKTAAAEGRDPDGGCSQRPDFKALAGEKVEISSGCPVLQCGSYYLISVPEPRRYFNEPAGPQSSEADPTRLLQRHLGQREGQRGSQPTPQPPPPPLTTGIHSASSFSFFFPSVRLFLAVCSRQGRLCVLSLP